MASTLSFCLNEKPRLPCTNCQRKARYLTGRASSRPYSWTNARDLSSIGPRDQEGVRQARTAGDQVLEYGPRSS